MTASRQTKIPVSPSGAAQGTLAGNIPNEGELKFT